MYLGRSIGTHSGSVSNSEGENQVYKRKPAAAALRHRTDRIHSHKDKARNDSIAASAARNEATADGGAGRGGGGRRPAGGHDEEIGREQVRLHGPQNWAAISEALAGRNPKSCRLRWCQHLSPIVDTARPFTPQEDEKIIASYRIFGSKWATIAGFLPGRTDNAIKNRWHSVLGKV